MKTGSNRRTRIKRPIAEAKQVEASSGNVFADLALDNPNQRLARAKLVQRISDIIAERGLPQAAAAAILGIDQPKISALIRGKLDGFSTDRLIRFLNALGQDVEIVVRPKRQRARVATVRVF
jgi:predicted XRE-type DNA-binding protein